MTRTKVLLAFFVGIVVLWPVVIAGSIAYRASERSRNNALIAALHGSVDFEVQYENDRYPGDKRRPPKSLIREIFGDDAVSREKSLRVRFDTEEKDQRVLDGYPGLRQVQLSGEFVNDQTIQRISDFPIERLLLFDTQVTTDGLRSVQRPELLKRLVVGDQTSVDQLLEPLGQFENLDYLDIGRTSVGGETLRTLHQCKNLKTLNVNRCTGIDRPSMTFIAQAKSLDKLCLLNSSVSAGWELLCDLPNLTTLVSYDSGITDADLTQIATAKSLRSLFVNEFALKPQFDIGLKNLPQLKSLSLNHVSLTDDALKSIGQLRSLTRLNLIFSSYSEQSAMQLSTLSELKHLKLSSDVSFEAAGQLHQSFPECEIVGHDRGSSTYRYYPLSSGRSPRPPPD